ncbi:TPA: methyltransferase, partial [Candidatus Bathyarchaeota archaeon]|nr:methyltransferase [Candidatus Bathyarchaeota archaeon]
PREATTSTRYTTLWRGRATPQSSTTTADDYRVSDACIRQLRRRAEHLHRNTDYAVMFFGAGSVHEWAQSLRGWKGWLMDLVGRKAMAEALLDRMMEVLTYNLKRYVSALSGYVSIVGFGDDLGTQTGPQVSPRTYRDMLRHHHEALFGYVKRHSRLFVFLHSCGSIYELIPDLIDAGVDILNPVQISARGMEPERLKKSFGEQITFWGGGVDTQRVFAFASPEAVAGHVRENVRVFAPGGGYVFNQVHNIQAKVPPENVVAAFEEAYEHGRYPISRM